MEEILQEDVVCEVEVMEWHDDDTSGVSQSPNDFPPPHLNLEESSISDPPVNEISSQLSAADETTYTIVYGGSSRGRDVLCDNNGYSYTVQRVNPSGTRLWRCNIRGKRNPCAASIREDLGGGYVKGLRAHNHQGKPGALETVIISKETKEIAMNEPFRSATQIAGAVLQKYLPSNVVKPVEYLSRNANNTRSHGRVRPKEPTTLDFELNEGCLPADFFVSDVKTPDARHIIFAMPSQLRLLNKARTWYVDTTFKVVNRPFYQLFTVHAFICSDGVTKQLPLIYCLMSRRRKSDYVAVLLEILSKLPSPQLQRIVTDFEAAICRAFTKVMPSVEMRGCAFHFTQAVFKHIKDLGLQKLYRARGTAYFAMTQLMALCYLPGSCIPNAFFKLKRKNEDSNLEELYSYVENTWINHTVWEPHNWSVYGLVVRTNNDVEGWDNHLNQAGKPNMPLYLLIQLLHNEAQFGETQVRLVSEGKLQRRRRKAREQDAELYKLWRKFHKGDTNLQHILKRIALIIGPRH